MEFEFRNQGFDGTQAGTSQVYKVRKQPWSSSQLLVSYILRVTAIVFTFISAIVVGAARETLTFVITDPSNDTTETATGSVKSTNFAAFMYFVVANAIAFFYSIISLAIIIAKRSGGMTKALELPISIADIVMAILLFSCNGAAAAIAIMAQVGQSQLGWDEICNIVDNFCNRIKASVVLSMLASLAYALIVIFAVIGLHKRS